jgi:Predicted xylanase/chitin deacetylase
MSLCLMLHGIGPTPPHVGNDEKPYWMNEETFALILNLAKKTALQITFDDGNKSDVDVALPALINAGLTASFFVLTSRIGQQGYLDQNDILRLHAAGMHIGSHGADHLHWTQTSNADIARDVTQSIKVLSQIIGEPVRSVAIPFGECDRRVLALLRQLGIARVYSSFRGIASDRAWIVRRECIKTSLSLADIETLITRKPSLAENTLNFLRLWRQAGRASHWSA